MNNTQNTLLWLDDARDPFDTEIDWLVFSPIGRNVEVKWVKDYDEFVNYINEFGIPNGICFDHDLGDGKTGYDCVNWLIEYCMDNNCDFPPTGFQSANPVGRENMMKKIENFRNIWK